MPSEVILPRVDMDMATGKISKWFVEPGAQVTKGQPLFEIETDKAAMEIEAPDTGTIRDIAAASGADIPVGSVVAWIYKAGEAVAEAPKASESAAAASKADERLAAENAVFDSRLPVATDDRSESRATVAVEEPSRPRATPMARRLAREHELDLTALQGSGPRGRIQAQDVTAASATKTPASLPVETTPAGSMGEAAAAANEPDPAPSAVVACRPLPAPPAAAPVGSSAGALNLVALRDGTGTPTLLIHGFGADANTWRPFLSGRSASCPVYALDLPGHGASPLGSVASFADLVDAVEAALAGAGLSTFDLVGHSLGGGVAAALAARGSPDIRSLLLVAPAGLGPAVNADFLQGFLTAKTEASLTPWMHELVVDASVITPAFVKATLKARDGSGLIAAQQRIAAAVFPDGTQAFSIRADLARLTVPTRVVVGGADAILPARYAAGLPGLVALHVLPNVGHMPQFEARETVAAILAQMTR